MQLKEYQTKVIEKFTLYLDELNTTHQKYLGYLEIDPDIAEGFDFTSTAWKKAKPAVPYKTIVNGIHKYTPSICLKVPTGGGKTILATHCIDEIQHRFINQKTGVVLWIVPSTQIYNQTYSALNDRNNPYRQVLDRSSGGRTVILTKKDRLTKQDTEEKLVVILLMLQSGNRENKETLKMYQLSGGYEGFFPQEDQYDLHTELLKQVPNLDTIGDSQDFFGCLVNQSFGNCLRILEPIVILDEGHKTYSARARDTIMGFNPKFILELTATPTDQSNVLVSVQGRDLEREDMIKLPIHVDNRTETDWRLVVAQAKKVRDSLESDALEYQQNTGEYIRPIQLIQVERTGKDQRDSGYIHSEDVKEFLVREVGVRENQIAIKSSEKDDIEGINLLSKDCTIRYIITKSALQEGWDCAFAYVLTVLAGGRSTGAMTQLVGRVLRQPFAQKTTFPSLNECYVITYKQTTSELVRAIKSGLEEEGLGDVWRHVAIMSGDSSQVSSGERTVQIRERFKHFDGKVFLPKFVVNYDGISDDLNFERDILKYVDWRRLNLDFVSDVSITQIILSKNTIKVDFSDSSSNDFLDVSAENVYLSREVEVDTLFVSRQLNTLIPNPWICYEIADKSITVLRAKYSDFEIANNLVHIIHELLVNFQMQVDQVCQDVFRNMLATDQMRFVLLYSNGGFTLPKNIKTSGTPLPNPNSTELAQYSLFDGIGEDDLNDFERSVALYFESQEKLLWWHRNLVGKSGYHIQGWEKGRVYADFIFTTKDAHENLDKVYVLETKGDHLIGNNDTNYKQNLFDLCNTIGIKKDWSSVIDEVFEGGEVDFQMVSQEDWRNSLNTILE
jgi:type III restriction enzyme